MSPTKQNNSLPTTKQSTASAMTTKKVKKAAPKASTAIITTNGEVIVRQILQGNYVHDSDHAVHAALLPFNGAAGMSCLCCNLVGINKHYSPISYTQSHGEKCKYHSIMCAWLSEHPEFHSLIPRTANLEGKLVLAPQLATTPIGDVFSLTTLTELQVELNQKLLEVKVAGDRLAGYTKMLVARPVSNTIPTVAITTAPSAAPVAKANEESAPLRRGGRKIKLSAKAQAAADKQK